MSTTDRINVVIAGKQPSVQWLRLDEAEAQFDAGASVWRWASTADGDDPDVVLACAGNVPTIETVAAAWMLRRDLPDLRIRLVNVFDLLALAPPDRHSHGMDEAAFESCFGRDVPVVFDFHGYPSAVHECLHGRPDPSRFHVKGYIEEGTTTTPYDLLAANGVTRHDIALEVIRRAECRTRDMSVVADKYARERDDIRAEVRRTGEDPASITEWTWS